MDFSNRGSQQSPAAPRPSSAFPTENNSAKVPVRNGRLRNQNKWLKWGAGVLVVAIAVLILALLSMSLLANNKSEDSYVDSNKLQAVFLTNNQVYFGKISQLNGKVLVLNNIYYLRTDSSNTANQSANNNVSLVKLGCELHKPYDTMIINRDQVQFWENLQSDGQVANAVKQYQSSNPQNNCSNSTSGAATGGNVQGSAAPTGAAPTQSGAPAPTTTKKP